MCFVFHAFFSPVKKQNKKKTHTVSAVPTMQIMFTGSIWYYFLRLIASSGNKVRVIKAGKLTSFK